MSRLVSCLKALCLVVLLLVSNAQISGAQAGELWEYWPEAERDAQAAYEELLVGVPEAAQFRQWHDRFSSEPHVAGSSGDRRVIEQLALGMAEMELEVEIFRFVTYLPEPVSAELEIVAQPSQASSADARVFGNPAAAELPLALPLREEAVAGDRYSGHPDLLFGWNGYSGSGEVTAEVIYVNYGRREDFESLQELGVSLEGKIVLARYGGNFRGFKAKFAQQAGAAGLIIFTDPADAGYVRGKTWPEGGWANRSYIQRGSLKTLPYPGDPLTPFVAATADAQRLDPANVDLPKIPVQPIGWGAAFEILQRMTGEVVPAEWQGGLPLAYRIQGGPELRLRLQVEQQRRLVETANVIGYLRGAERPEEMVVIGGHHDAWSFGAGDPNAGTIVTFEVARSFAEAAKKGHRPARTLAFAHWGAEEQGIIGSTEWVEAQRQALLDRAVAYINLDGAAMGKKFSSGAAPSLKRLISQVTKQVPHPDGDTVWQHWAGDEEPPFGNLGGGSDHVGFYCHVAVPSANISAGGSPGSSYHSNYENLDWYRSVVGDDYEGAGMLAQIVDRMAARLANGALLPLDPTQYGVDALEHLEHLQQRAKELGVDLATAGLTAAIEAYNRHASEVYSQILAALAKGQLAGERLAKVNSVLLQMERQWLHQPGLPERPWFRNLFAATDPDSGYAAWMLPALRWAVERQAEDQLPQTVALYTEAFERLASDLDDMAGQLGVQ